MKILVSGASGILGYGLISQLLQEGHNVQGIINSNTSGIVHKNYTESSLNLSSNKNKLRDFFCNSTHFIHCANYTPSSVDSKALIRNQESINLNLNTFRSFFDSDCQNIIFISSASVYPFKKKHTVIEESDFQTGVLDINKRIYAMNKIFCESVVETEALHQNKKYAILRPSNIYGYSKNLRLSNQLIPSVIKKIQNNEDLNFINAKKHTRDFIYSKDIGSAIHKMIIKGLKNECYTISSGENSSLEAIILKISKALNKNSIKLKNIENESDFLDISYSNKKLSSEYGWSPKYSLNKGLKDLISRIG